MVSPTKRTKRTARTARTPESGFPACGGDNQVAELPEEEIDYFLSGFGVIVTHEAERQQFSRGNDK